MTPREERSLSELDWVLIIEHELFICKEARHTPGFFFRCGSS